MNIRLMTISDYEAVYELWTGTAGMGLRSLDDSYEGISRFLMRNPATCFVAEYNGKIAGTILCGHDGRRGYIYHTSVSENYRKLGIGTALVEAAVVALKAERINKAALVVFKENETGNVFWEKLGFGMRNDLAYRNISLNDENK